jgi:hypothetical protein
MLSCIDPSVKIVTKTIDRTSTCILHLSGLSHQPALGGSYLLHESGGGGGGCYGCRDQIQIRRQQKKCGSLPISSLYSWNRYRYCAVSAITSAFILYCCTLTAVNMHHLPPFWLVEASLCVRTMRRENNGLYHDNLSSAHWLAEIMTICHLNSDRLWIDAILKIIHIDRSQGTVARYSFIRVYITRLLL